MYYLGTMFFRSV